MNLKHIFQAGMLPALLLQAALGLAQTPVDSAVIHFIYTSDPHFGISKAKFRGKVDVPASKVNAAMVKQFNRLPFLTIPTDSGVGSGIKINGIACLIETGDIANRMEPPVQPAARSWRQFTKIYLKGLRLKTNEGQPTPVLLVPGNHDISNAIGFYRPMKPQRDASSMAGIYNLMMQPQVNLTSDSYSYPKDRIIYSKDMGGLHFIFLSLWPDSAQRNWMDKDLAKVPKSTPVLIFTHDQPTCEAKHFTNPVAPHLMTAENKFENLVPEYYREGSTASADGGNTELEQKDFVRFLKKHPNIKAYFHGNSNWNEFYTYTGPDHDLSLNTFRVDSPMKGKFSSKDEHLLSFQLISLDGVQMKLSVRECLWNQSGSQSLVTGAVKTIDLK